MKQRILIVEDDRWMADVYHDVLQDNYDVTVCHDAAEAIDVLDEAPPDMILLDVMLPGSDGLALLQELRSYHDMADVPICVCTSVGFSSAQRQAIKQFAPIEVIDKAHATPEAIEETCSKALKR